MKQASYLYSYSKSSHFQATTLKEVILPINRFQPMSARRFFATNSKVFAQFGLVCVLWLVWFIVPLTASKQLSVSEGLFKAGGILFSFAFLAFSVGLYRSWSQGDFDTKDANE